MDIKQQVKLICKTYNIRPSKSKGQNFLVELSSLDSMIQAAEITKNDTVLEIGPGLGVLTEKLLEHAKSVVSVELDDSLFSFLSAKFAGKENLKLVHADILQWNPETELTNNEYSVVANLPYNITSAFLKKFMTSNHKPKTMTLLLQKEVAQRICEKPGAMSLLSLSIQLYGTPLIVSEVDRKNFWPEPDVDSAILHVSNILSEKDVEKKLDGLDEKKFWQVAKIGFSAKRKQLINNFSNGLHISSEKSKKILENAGISPQSRAQNLSIQQWIVLAKAVDKLA